MGILAIALVIFASSPGSAREPSQEKIASFKRAVVVVTTYDDHGKPLLQGSGFFIKSDRIVTNCHVISQASEIRVESFGGETFTVRSVIAMDRSSDLALLQLDKPHPEATTLQVADELANEDDWIIVVSNPQGSPWKVTYGRVGRTWQFAFTGERMQITADIFPGSSGGPVLNQQGQVIGIASMRIDSADDLNFAVPAERLKALQASASVTSNLTGLNPN